MKQCIDPLNAFLLKTAHAVGAELHAHHRRGANALDAEVLEQLRLLTNLETNERKLLQIILIGQPELRDLLARPELEQLAQRVIARYHLGALTETETEAYIRHRLSVAGMKSAMPFDAKAMQRVHKLSRGVPRRINLLCDRALLGAYSAGQGQVTRAIVDTAAAEVFDRESIAAAGARSLNGRTRLALALGGIVGVALITGLIAASLGGSSRGAAEGALATGASGASSPRSIASAAGSGNALGTTSLSTAAASTAASAAPASFITAADLPRLFKTLTRSEKEAWRELTPAWQLTLGDGDPCAQAQRAQVPCFRSSGSTLALIRQLDRPGILMLNDEANQPVYALLTGLGPQSATLRVGGVAQTVSLVSLATLWRGDFATLWRAPPGYAGRVVDAGSGVPASWLAERLATLRGEPTPPDDALSNSGWRARLSAFQLAQGLKPDGLAGPTTFMQLNRASGIDEPRLQALAGTR